MTKKVKPINFIRGDSKELEFGRIPFNIRILDDMIAGGIPRKHFTIISGMPSVGKTYLAYKLARSVINEDKEKVYWIDAEDSHQPSWAEHCGVDTTMLQVFQPTHAEEAYEAIRSAIHDNASLIVLDSIASLVPTAMLEQDFEYNPIGLLARSLSANLPKIAADLRESQNSTLVAINQLRAAISQFAPDTLVGGRAQSYQAHLMLELRKEGYMTVDKERQGHYIRTKLTKTKVGGKTDSSVLIPFHYEGGIDNVEISIEAALKKKIIQNSGAWYYYQDNKIQGRIKVKDFFDDNPELYKELEIELAT